MNLFWISTLCSSLLLQLVSGDTWFELRLIRFENPTGRESDGDCCDFPCSDPCDPDIVVCIDKPDTPECSLAKRFTGHYHANTFSFGPRFENGAINPMTVKIVEPWPQLLYITVKVEDRDSINANDPMGKIRKTFTRVPAADERTAKWNHVDFEFSYQMITAQARVYCERNYYGDDCMTYCEAKSNLKDGYYTCSEKGQKVCLDNYHGNRCDSYCKPSDDINGHYRCSTEGDIVCLDGWNGLNCTLDINECDNGKGNPCLNNGSCINIDGSFDCVCHDNYTGIHCEERKRWCEETPCTNNSTCNNTFGGFQCICHPEWTGVYCHERVTPCTSKPCLHHGLCTVLTTTMQTTYSCQCIGMWEGMNCDDEIMILLNDTKVLYLKGRLAENQWDDLTIGIRHLLKDILRIEDVVIETTVTYPSDKQTRVEIFVESPDLDVVGSLDKILVLPPEEVKTSLILPLSETQAVARDAKRKPDPWVKKHWYVVLAVVAAIIASMTIFALIMYAIKKKRRHNMEKTGTFDSQRSHSGRDSLPDAAVGFDNSLYFEANNPDKVRGLPEIPKSALKENGHTNTMNTNGRKY